MVLSGKLRVSGNGLIASADEVVSVRLPILKLKKVLRSRR
jgi:hypothetical protein